MGIGGFVGVALMMYGLRYVWRIFIFGTSFRLENEMRNTIFKHLTRLSSTFFQENRTGELMALATHDLNSVQAVAGRGVLQLFDSLFSGVSVLLAMFLTISWKLTLIAIIPMPFLIVASQYLSKKLHKTFHVAQEAFSDMNNRVLENINGIKVTKTFGQEENEIKRFKSLAQDVYQKNLAVTRYDALFDPVIITISTLCIFLTLIVGSYFVFNNEIASRNIELISGELTYDEDCYYEIFQWFIISDPSFAMDHTDELIFYDNELNLYILGVTHYGTAWDYVSAPDFH